MVPDKSPEKVINEDLCRLKPATAALESMVSNRWTFLDYSHKVAMVENELSSANERFGMLNFLDAAMPFPPIERLSTDSLIRPSPQNGMKPDNSHRRPFQMQVHPSLDKSPQIMHRVITADWDNIVPKWNANDEKTHRSQLVRSLALDECIFAMDNVHSEIG